MERNRIAPILSFVYCGFGQIYSGEILKGLDYVLIYTALLASLSIKISSPILGFIRIFAIVIFWLMGIADARFNNQENAFLPDRYMKFREALNISSFGIISGVIIVLMVLWLQPRPVDTQRDFRSMLEKPEIKKDMVKKSEENKTALIEDELQKEKETNNSKVTKASISGFSKEEYTQKESQFFTIQIGAFTRDSLDKAEKLRDTIDKNNYTVRIESPRSNNDKWYRVLVGHFESRQKALDAAKELSQKEGLSYIIVSRIGIIPETEKLYTDSGYQTKTHIAGIH
ncbi:hypothetical protein GF312_12480 [Candidatus Poribacteria bacterium]|nr:hypothetical protein [Candidatus Poribacteria bacterium]